MSKHSSLEGVTDAYVDAIIEARGKAEADWELLTCDYADPMISMTEVSNGIVVMIARRDGTGFKYEWVFWSREALRAVTSDSAFADYAEFGITEDDLHRVFVRRHIKNS